MFKFLICTAALAAALPVAAGTPADGESSVTVRYLDLNLSHPAGMAQLERRIDSAARSVCGARSSSETSLGAAQRSRQCVTKAKAGAMSQLATTDGAFQRGG